MVKSKQTYLKRQKEEKKKTKRKEKDEKKESRKGESNKGKGFESMIAYVDENGQLSDTPPDPAKRKVLNLEDIQLGAHQPDPNDNSADGDSGRVYYYNEAKGYGFIKDNQTKESVFFHLSDVLTPVKINDLVSYKKYRGAKSAEAQEVTVVA
jgi:cold shock CspA family protein